MEIVDILIPPTFEKSGKTKPRNQAIADGNWIGTFNLWIVQTKPIPAIVYQVRSSKSTWAPNKLDVTAGGHYQAGETILEGMREVKEELGKVYDHKNLFSLGRKLHLCPDVNGHERHNLVDIFLTLDNSDLSTYRLEKTEVYAICACPIEDLIKVNTLNNYSFTTKILTNDNQFKSKVITKDSFPYNWDNYHYKIAKLADRYIKGEKNLLY